MPSATLDLVRGCVVRGQTRISRHAAEEMDDDHVEFDDVVQSVGSAEVVEDYPAAQRGPSVLALHRLRDGGVVHVLWAFHKGTTAPAVLVTTYRPDPARWSPDFLRRRA